MAKACGYIAPLSKARFEKFLGCVLEEQDFSDPVPEFLHSRSAPLVCFITNGQEVSHIAIGKRGIRAGTGLRRLNFKKAEELDVPLSLEKILPLVASRNRAFVREKFKAGGLLTVKAFAAVLEAVRHLSPQSSSILEKYSVERAQKINRLSSNQRQSLAYQKEAILTALSIADIPRESIQDWTPTDEVPASFLDGLPNTRIREDPMIIHDFMNLPGYDIIKKYPYNAAVFESDTERLTVIVANRQPLESQTGTDLIYFNETYQSFVMVQYKAMESEDNKHGAPRPTFRLPNSQLAEEIQRMDALAHSLKACSKSGTHHGFRLSENPFFLKLCPRLIFKPDDIGLVPGMYLPLDYWKRLETQPCLIGPHGGVRIMYENVGRYMDNTAFTTVVAKAWVGTTPDQSIVLKEVIRQTLETGKAVAIAVKSKEKHTKSYPAPLTPADIERLK